MKKNILLATALIASMAIPFTATHAGDYTKDNKETAAVSVSKMDIVDTAMGNQDLSTLVAALKAADLVDALKADGPYTVFAPTNAAFDALPEGTLASLLEPENKSKLQDILKYHVVEGSIKAEDIEAGSTEVTTLSGDKLTIMKNESGVTINDATVINPNVGVSNGTVHVIDKVVMAK